MIIYFADRKMQVLGQASTGLPKGFAAIDDKKTEDIDTGVATFECTVGYEPEDRLRLQEVIKAGNYVLRYNDGENEFYTIIDSELDVDKQEIYLYAEDAGLDLLNEVALAYEATETHPIAWYVEKWAEGSGFEIKINEIPNLTRTLKWGGESTVTERLASVATQFDNAEISYSFDIDGLRVLHKYINIYKSRGKDVGEQLRINKNLNNIVIKTSVANVATALYVTGGTPEGEDAEPITLAGYNYDDGDIYTDGAYLKSRSALAKWSRFLSDSGTGDGNITATYSFDATSQSELCSHAVTELKKRSEAEVNYEVDIAELPEGTKIGDRVNLIDDAGEIYLSARLLKLETSVVNKTQKATLGEYLIKDSGISEQVEALASQFAEIAKSRNFYTWIVYADDENGNGITLDPTGKPYMGISANRSSAEPDLTDPSVYKWSKIEGDKGDLGLSLVSIIEHYLVSPLSEGITISTTGWSTETIPVMTSTNKYLWNYETLVYSDESTEDLDPKIIGVYGDTGEAGESAPEIVSMTEQYYMSTSATELSGGEWVRTMPEWSPGKYLWTRWCTEWNEPNPELLTYSEPVLATAFNEIHETADDAKTAADEAKESAESAVTQVGQVGTELAQAQQELEAVTENLETLENNMTANYATKGELTQVETDLGTQISQNAAQISQTATKVQEVETNASQALQDAANAQAAADTAQQNATDAQNKYTQLKQQADATDEQLAAAEEAVGQAQADATAAGDAAAAAAAAASALADRVTTAEANITLNAEQISQTVEKVEAISIGGRNLILGSYLEETSTEYGFGEQELSTRLEPETEYTFTVNGFVTAGDEGKSLLAVLAADDGSWQQSISITETVETTKSITFTTPTGIEDKDVTVKYYYSPESAEGATLSGSCTVNWAKLEKGNKATDWTPAPEDVNVDIADSITEASTEILQSAESITMEILSGYTTTDDLNSYKEEIQNLFIGSEEGFEMQFNTLSQQLNTLGNQIITQSSFIRFVGPEDGGPKIVIGSTDSGDEGTPIRAEFTKEALIFYYGDQVVARFTNEVLEVQNIHTDNQVGFGSNWAIRPGQYIESVGGYNLDLVWTGG